jgi:hypothetical protein
MAHSCLTAVKQAGITGIEQILYFIRIIRVIRVLSFGFKNQNFYYK